MRLHSRPPCLPGLDSSLPSSCAPVHGSIVTSRFAFPNHLNNASEQNALGIDVNEELRSILRKRPKVVVMMSVPYSKPVNWSSRALLQSELAKDYERYAVVKVGEREFQLFSPRPAALATRPATTDKPA